MFIVQVKKSLPLVKNDLKREIRLIVRHFKKLKSYKVDGVKPRKVLFFVGWKYGGKGFEEEMERFGSDYAFKENRRLFLSNELRKRNIELNLR